jgi:uncharacterized membrane protein
VKRCRIGAQRRKSSLFKLKTSIEVCISNINVLIMRITKCWTKNYNLPAFNDEDHTEQWMIAANKDRMKAKL